MSDHPDLGVELFSPRALKHEETQALLDMFRSDGWAVFMDLRRLDLKASLDIAMNLDAPQAVREQHVVAYNAVKDTMEFEQTLRQALKDKAEQA